MIVHQCEQGSPEWFELRRGVPTASQFHRILTGKGKLSAGADQYICELIADKMRLGPPLVTYRSGPMRDGQATEAEARSWYEMEVDLDVQRVGFVTTDDGRFGCSPDSLVGDHGGLELKCPTGKVHAGYVLAGEHVPRQYRPQVHGALAVTDRQFWDFLSYSAGMPPLLVRVCPDWYTETLRDALELFWEKYQKALAKMGR